MPFLILLTRGRDGWWRSAQEDNAIHHSGNRKRSEFGVSDERGPTHCQTYSLIGGKSPNLMRVVCWWYLMILCESTNISSEEDEDVLIPHKSSPIDMEKGSWSSTYTNTIDRSDIDDVNATFISHGSSRRQTRCICKLDTQCVVSGRQDGKSYLYWRR